MRPIKIFLSLFIIIISSVTSIQAQTIDCKKFKNGTFKMTFEGKNGIIKRYGAIQEEYLNGEGKPTMTFAVKWLSNCTYTLTPTAATRKSFPDIPKEGLMTVNIVHTTSNSYSYSAKYSWDKKNIYKNVLT